MTVSMRLMTAGDGYKYLLKSVAAGDGERSLSTPLTRYYTEQGCPPGQWLGSGLQSLQPDQIGVGDTVTETQLQLLIGQGRNPLTGDPLGRAYPQYQTLPERIAQRAEALDPELHDDDRAAAVQAIEHEEAQRGMRRAVAGFDYTFSLPKSVSALWAVADAGTQTLIAQAHHQAIAEVLDFMEREVAATRTGANAGDGAVAQADVTGFLATGFDHYDSRAGDPHYHSHIVISNKVCTAQDSRWRSLDSRPMHAATVALSEHHQAILADHMTRLFGVEWEARDRGRDRSPAWDITGVPVELLTEFSSRARDIDAETARRIDRYAAEHGRHPSKAVIIELRRQAALATRPDKQIRSLADLTAEWRDRARTLLRQDASGWAGKLFDNKGQSVLLRADDVPLDLIARVAGQVVQVVGEKRSTWRRWNLWAEASRQTMGWRFVTSSDREAVTGMIVDAAQDASLRLTPVEMSVPAEFQREDGTSQFRPKHMTLYSSQALLDAEDRLLTLARDTSAPTVPYDTVAAITEQPDERGLLPGPDQAAAVTAIATSGRTIDVLVGPAGAGKTTTLAVLRKAWETAHGPGTVVGLAPSATAAAVLADDLGIACENTARWLAEHDHLGRDFQPGQLVLIDEASLAGTFTLDRITALAHQARAKTVLVGDVAQLQAVDVGGAFNLIVSERDDAPELTDIHRFRSPWEKIASLQMRHGNPACIDAYYTHDRLIQGDLDDVTQQAYQDWQADVEAGLASLLVAEAADTVRELNQRARHDRIIAGLVEPDQEITLDDGSRASKGDVVITRRNDRRLVAGKTGWVRNGDRWTVIKTHSDGSITVRRAGHRRGATVILPATYAKEHLDLGYAVTTHRAQGVTVDTSHTVITHMSTRENLYVAMTRGRESNTAYIAVDRPDRDYDLTRSADSDVTARTVLHTVLQRSGAELSAHQAIRAEAEKWGNLAQLCAELETLIDADQRDRWTALIADCGLDQEQIAQVLMSETFGPLCSELRRAEVNGIHPEAALPRLVAARSMAGAADIASVLHERVVHHIEHAQTSRGVRPFEQEWTVGLAPVPHRSGNRAMAAAIAERQSAIEARAAEMLQRAIKAKEPWITALGSVPKGSGQARRWRVAAQAIAAYRDRYQVANDTPLGIPTSVRQQQDAARIRRIWVGEDARVQPTAFPDSTPIPVQSVSL